jgi:hypothetical protein
LHKTGTDGGCAEGLGSLCHPTGIPSLDHHHGSCQILEGPVQKYKQIFINYVTPQKNVMSHIKRHSWNKLNACSPPTMWEQQGHSEAVASRCAVVANIF